jgi:rhodanese-related sulfurtransferase
VKHLVMCRRLGSLLMFLALAPAQAASIEDALKDIPQANPPCEVKAEGPPQRARAPELPPAQKGVPRETDAGIAARLIEAGAVVVDLRPPAEYRRFHIAGALNHTPGEVRTKAFLKNKILLLVGSGREEQSVAAAARQLSAAGFADVSLLRGGMISWIVAGKSVLGEAPSLQELVYLSPGDLMREAGVAENSVLLAGNAAALQPLLPAARTRSVKAMDDSLLQLLRSQSQKQGSAVLVSGADLSPAWVEQAVRAAAPRSLLVYAAPEWQFSQFVEGQRAVWKRVERGPPPKPCNQ